MFKRLLFPFVFAFSLCFSAVVRADATQDAIKADLDVIVEILNYGFALSATEAAVTWPVDEDMEPYSTWLKPSLYDSSDVAYLYSILQAVRSLTNSPASTDLSTIESDLSGLLSSSGDITGYMADYSDWIYSIETTVHLIEGLLSSLDTDIYNIANHVGSNTYGDHMWYSHLDEDQLTTITLSIQDALQDVLDEMGPGYDLMTQATQETRLEVKEALARLAEKINLLVLDLHELIEPVQSLDAEVQDQTLLLTDSRNDLHSLLLAFSNSTNIEVVEGFNQHAGVTNAPTVGQLNGQFRQTENLASTNETATRSELSDYESSSTYELPVLDFNSMIPGEITPLRAFEPNFDNTPSLADSYTIPILSSPLQAGSVTIDAFSLDLATGSAYDNVMRPFKESIGPITEQIWNLIFAISVLLLAKYEWKAYMSGVGPSVAAHEQQERQDYDGYIF